jgi:hypothetical protein
MMVPAQSVKVLVVITYAWLDISAQGWQLLATSLAGLAVSVCIGNSKDLHAHTDKGAGIECQSQ